MTEYLNQNPSECSESAITPEIWEAAINYYHQHRKELIQAASFARENAVSYRGFKVGACVLGYNPKLPAGEYLVYQAYNHTPAPNLNRKGKDKRCAERNALEVAVDDGCSTIPAMATVSKFVDTGDPSKAHDCLHPCKDCRDLFRELLQKGVLKRESMFCSANDSENGEEGRPTWRIEEKTIGDSLDLYHDDVE